MTCLQELCRNWTGQGCACEVMGIEPDVVANDELPDGPPTSFSIALDAWRDHLREIGYSTPDVTIMLIGFGAGWEAHLDANL